jgi:hypothetical protein
MRIGLIARSDRSGLGFQTKALYDYLKPDKTLVIDSTPFNGRAQVKDWYREGVGQVMYSNGFMSNETTSDFLKDIDVVITCEVPYNDMLYTLARKRGIKTILQPNAELNPHFLERRLDLPDVFFLPSSWLMQETLALGVPCHIVKPPIIQPRLYKEIPKEVGTLKVLHFGGRRAAHDRNGTEVVRQLPHIQGIYLDIHDQAESEIEDQRDLYEKDYHVILIPRRYGGLCLPMLEALSYGIPVIMPNIEPNRQELPLEWLTSATKGKRIRTKNRIDTYDPDTQSIEWMLERFRDMDQEAYNAERAKANELYKAHQDQLKLWKELI